MTEIILITKGKKEDNNWFNKVGISKKKTNTQIFINMEQRKKRLKLWMKGYDHRFIEGFLKYGRLRRNMYNFENEDKIEHYL